MRMKPGEWTKAAVPPSRSGSTVSRGSPSVKMSTFELGRSSGPTSAGAWAARFEVANMLEAKCSPADLIAMIRVGKEGTRSLTMDGSLGPGVMELDDRDSAASQEGSVEQGDLDAEVARQKAIMDSLMSVDTRVPPWEVKSDQGSRSPRPGGHSNVSSQSSTGLADQKLGSLAHSIERGFKKRAKPPSEAVLKKLKGETQPEVEKAKAAEVPMAFEKRAKPPVDLELAKSHRPQPFKGSLPRGKQADLSSKEEAELAKFTKKALALYAKFEDYGVSMDLTELVELKDGYVDTERFKSHTLPNRAATGLRYARLMEAHFKWLREVDNPFEGRENAFEKLGILGFMEYIIQRKAGARTPQGLLYAVDFFGKAFGFGVAGSHFDRAKRLSLRYAQMTKVERCGAPMFTRTTLVALERILLDQGAPIAHRVTAGKLRLCIQASIRHSDLNYTPISCCEWIRRRGEIDIVGIRAKALRGKTGARAWVASVLAADKSNDQWLQTLMKLLLEAHGPGYAFHDHFGRLPNAEGNGFHNHPSSIEADVYVVKNALGVAARRGEEVGLTIDQVETLRWHGAKATLTSVMQHLNLSSKTIRFSGDWKDSKEAMPDVYLREAQLMVLRGQERALAYLRAGGDIGGLVGEPVFKEVPEGSTNADFKRCEQAMVDQELGEFGQSPVYFSAEFMDAVLKGTSDLPDLDMLEKERSSTANDTEASALLEDETESENEKDGQDAANASADKGTKQDEQLAAESDDEAEDFEGMVSVFVQIKKPVPTSKIHRGREHGMAGPFYAEARPMCGAKGSYDYINAEEAMDSELCIRCFGRSAGCSYLCSRKVVGKDGTVRRCARRCMRDGDHLEHQCHMHGSEETV